MKKFVKILILSVLAVLALTCFIACGPSEELGTKGLKFKFDRENDYYIVISYNGEESNVAIPNEYQGKAVGRIKSEAFAGNETIKTLSIPKSVKVIDNGALGKMKALESVTLPFIGKTAVAVTELDKSNVKKMDASINEERTFGYIFATEEYDGGIEITQSYNSSSTNKCYLPATLTMVIVDAEVGYNIPAYAFNGVSSLYKITLSEGIGVIGEYAFANCATLNTMFLPKSVTEICAYAFSDCPALKEYKVVSVGEEYRAIGFKFIENSELKTIKEGAFVGTQISKFELPSKLETIGKYAFASVDSTGAEKPTAITKVSIPSSIKLIDDYAFYKSSLLEEVNYGVGADYTLGNMVFAYCPLLVD